MLNFDSLEKVLGIVFVPDFVNGFSRKMFKMFEIKGNMCIAIVCFLGCDIINFEINLIFLIKPFLYMTKRAFKMK